MMAVNGIEIEVGQKWLCRDGKERTVIARDDETETNWVWDISDDRSVTKSGHELGPDVTRPGDLIELLEHADGFKPWAGGEQPEETRGKQVAHRMRSGTEASEYADRLDWLHTNWLRTHPLAHIVAYKVVGETTTAEPLRVEMIEPAVSAPALLTAAAKHMTDRAATYDKPEGERSMAQTVAVFEAHHGIKLTEAQGWHFMQILKDVRLFTRGAYHADSAEDCIAYAALKAEAKAQEGGAK